MKVCAPAVALCAALSCWTCSRPALAGEEAAPTVDSVYPGLATGVLTFAKLGKLPDRVLLRAETVEISPTDLEDIINKQSPLVADQLRRNAFFLLERLATDKILLLAAKQDRKATSGMAEQKILREYYEKVTEQVEVTDDEIAKFYAENKWLLGDSPLGQVENTIRQYLLEQKRQDTMDAHVRGLGRKIPITVNSEWVKVQAPLARDNPIDKARASGRPVLAGFGGGTCCGPDKTKHVLSALAEKYKGKLDVVYVEARQEPVLAARYGIESLPTQIFFDKDGKEVSRTVGCSSQEEIERRLEKIGIGAQAK